MNFFYHFAEINWTSFMTHNLLVRYPSWIYYRRLAFIHVFCTHLFFKHRYKIKITIHHNIYYTLQSNKLTNSLLLCILSMIYIFPSLISIRKPRNIMCTAENQFANAPVKDRTTTKHIVCLFVEANKFVLIDYYWFGPILFVPWTFLHI